MEIERKFLINTLPDGLSKYPSDTIRQAYISTDPVIRVRQKSNDYNLTIKSQGLLAREETELPLSEESFSHLLKKADGIPIEKVRYRIPDSHGYLIELDIFRGAYEGFIMAEVEFPSVEEALAYTPPAWFGKDVTDNPEFHNSRLSQRSKEEICEFLSALPQ